MKHRATRHRTSSAKHSFRRTLLLRRLSAAFIISGIALLGYTLIASISAATYSVPKEVETATLAGKAQNTVSSTASGGSAVTFGGGSASGAWSDTDLFADPLSNAAVEAKKVATSNPARAARMQKMAQGPMVEWMGDWKTKELNMAAEPALLKATGDYMNRVTAQGANKIGLIAVYGILQRDCGGASTGGFKNQGEYEAFIRGISRGVAQKRAILILEPDALPQLTASGCLDGNAQNLRLTLMSNAVNYFKANNPNAKVFIDAGHSAWNTDMANRLRRANVAKADGFATNISNFQLTANEITYGNRLSGELGGKKFIVDTSRNGRGPNGGEWCNPRGRALGQKATFNTNSNNAYMFLWIKQAGESDGNTGADCAGKGAPGPGQWWPDYADELARNAGY